MLVLDTDHWSELGYHSFLSAQNLLDRLILSGELVVTTVITAEESLRGWLSEIHSQPDPTQQQLAYDKFQQILGALQKWK